MSVIRSHPRLVLTCTVGFILLVAALIAELALRALVSYRIDYYTGVSTSSSVLKYPFGDIVINSQGHPDREWDSNERRPRVGVIGDSVTFGIGVGTGYRYTDLLGKHLPDLAILNFGGVGEHGISGDRAVKAVAALAKRYGLRKVVYGMNLNDILPNSESGEALRRSFALEAMHRATRSLDYLRGRSYLYNTLRTRVKLVLVRLGYERHGMEAFELMPSKNATVVRDTAGRVNALARALAREGVGLCVIVFPYEMQVSSEAARTYAGFGITWEAAFEDGLTQQLLRSAFDGSFVSVDALGGFRKALHNARTARVGEYFVYNRGDKLDWNHPNRAGHQIIAEYVATTEPGCMRP